VATLLLKTKDKPEVGASYYLEPAKSGTQEQNKAFHALCMEFFKSGLHSYNVESFEGLKNNIKKALGSGFESFVYIDVDPDSTFENIKYIMFDAKTKDDIPKDVKEDPEFTKHIRGKLKSWSKYSKKERTRTIDNLITEMIAAGVNSKKFEEIIEGMKSEIL